MQCVECMLGLDQSVAKASYEHMITAAMQTAAFIEDNAAKAKFYTQECDSSFERLVHARGEQAAHAEATELQNIMDALQRGERQLALHFYNTSKDPAFKNKWRLLSQGMGMQSISNRIIQFGQCF